MVRNQTPLHIDLNQTMRLRREADGLLRRLERHRQATEQVYAEIGKRDAMRAVTGRSAIEQAIETTRGMIRNMDDLLEEVAAQVGDLATQADTNQPVEAARKQLVESR